MKQGINYYLSLIDSFLEYSIYSKHCVYCEETKTYHFYQKYRGAHKSNNAIESQIEILGMCNRMRKQLKKDKETIVNNVLPRMMK